MPLAHFPSVLGHCSGLWPRHTSGAPRHWGAAGAYSSWDINLCKFERALLRGCAKFRAVVSRSSEETIWEIYSLRIICQWEGGIIFLNFGVFFFNGGRCMGVLGHYLDLGFCLSFLFVWLFNSNLCSLIPDTWNVWGRSILWERSRAQMCGTAWLVLGDISLNWTPDYS